MLTIRCYHTVSWLLLKYYLFSDNDIMFQQSFLTFSFTFLATLATLLAFSLAINNNIYNDRVLKYNIIYLFIFFLSLNTDLLESRQYPPRNFYSKLIKFFYTTPFPHPLNLLWQVRLCYIWKILVSQGQGTAGLKPLLGLGTKNRLNYLSFAI